jgi:hypothetical protein
VVDRPLTQRDLRNEVALRVDLEQMADALARIAVVAVDGLREPLGRNLDLDRGHEEHVADLHHSLRMERLEIDRHRLDRFPGRSAGQFHDPLDEGIPVRLGRHDGRTDAGEAEDRQADGDRAFREAAHRGSPF